MGWFIIIIATLGILISWSSPTTVGDTHNIGLMNDRHVNMVAWTAFGLLGGLFVIAGRVKALLYSLGH